MIIIMQFLLHIYKKNVLLLRIPTEQLKFCIQVSRILFFSNLFEQKLFFKCSKGPTRCGIVRNHRTTFFSRLIYTTLWQPPFFPSVHYANQLPLMSQLSQSDIASSGLCLIPSWIYKKRSIFCTPHQQTSCTQNKCISTAL